MGNEGFPRDRDRDPDDPGVQCQGINEVLVSYPWDLVGDPFPKTRGRR